MTKTKAIDVWVSHKFENKNTDLATIILHNGSNVEDFYKAKLIIEIPEKKIEITESQFYKAIEQVNTRNSHKSIYCDVSDLASELGF